MHVGVLLCLWPHDGREHDVLSVAWGSVWRAEVHWNYSMGQASYKVDAALACLAVDVCLHVGYIAFILWTFYSQWDDLVIKKNTKVSSLSLSLSLQHWCRWPGMTQHATTSHHTTPLTHTAYVSSLGIFHYQWRADTILGHGDICVARVGLSYTQVQDTLLCGMVHGNPIWISHVDCLAFLSLESNLHMGALQVPLHTLTQLHPLSHSTRS